MHLVQVRRLLRRLERREKHGLKENLQRVHEQNRVANDVPVDAMRLTIGEAKLCLTLEPFASSLLRAQAQDAISLFDGL